MAILNQKRILNLIPKVSAPVTIHVSQGDVGTEIEFTLVKGDEVFVNPGNVSASVHGVREDGANFGPFTCTLSGSKVTFPLHSEMTAVKGSALAEIVLVNNGGNKVGSANFGILVEEAVFPLGVTYDNDVSVYESILKYAQTIPAQLNSEISNVKSALNSEIGTRQSADALINTRLDEIVSPSGEAPNPAEIVDARIGIFDYTYPSLGNALRDQVATIDDTARMLQTYLDTNEYVAMNNPSAVTYTDGYAINEDGTITTASTYRYSSLISVEKNDTRRLYWARPEGTTDAILRVHGYDENGNWVKQLYASASKTKGLHVGTFNTQGCPQIRVSLMKGVQNARYLLAGRTLAASIKQNDNRYDSQGVIKSLKPYITFKENMMIDSNNGNETGSSYYSCTDFIDIEGHEGIVYTANTIATNIQSSPGYALYDANYNYISGQKNARDLNASTYIFDRIIENIPSNAKYIRCSFPTNLIDSFAIYDLGNWENSLKRKLNVLSPEIKPVSLNWYSMGDGVIRWGDGTIGSSSYNRYTNFIYIADYEKIVYKRMIQINAGTPSHGMAFYDQDMNYISGIPNRGNARKYGYEYYTVDVPEDAVYARFTIGGKQYDEGYGYFGVWDYNVFNRSLVAEVNYLFENEGVVNEALISEVPQNEGVQAAILRARQLTDIIWTPVAEMPGVINDPTLGYIYKTFKKGCRQKGIPYGSGLNKNQRVGDVISVDAFATAVMSADSVLYTNNEYSEQTPKKASYYGIPCSKFVQFCWGAPERYDSQNIFDLPGIEKIAEPKEYTVDDIQLGDGILNPQVHCVICTDILRNYKGEIRALEISEAIAPTCRRLIYSPKEFYDRFDTYGLYRYPLITNSRYEKARYVDVDDGITGEKDIPIAIKRGSYINMASSSSWKAVVDSSKWVTLHDVVEGVEQTSAISSDEIALPKNRLGYHEIYPTDANGNKGNSSFYFVYNISELSATKSGNNITVDYAANAEAIAICFGNYYYEYITEDVGSVTTEIPSGQIKCSILFKTDYGCFYSNDILIPD